MISLLAGFSPRERLLLSLLAGVVLPLALLFGVLLPLQERRTLAQEALQEAQALQLWVQDQARRAPRPLDSSASEAPAVQAIGTSGLEQALLAADLRGYVTRLSDQGDGAVALGFEAIPFERFTGWLNTMRPVWGYAVQTILLERGGEAGLVQAELTLVPQE